MHTEEKDLLYKSNKYANSSQVILDKKYILKKRVSILLNGAIFLFVLILGFFLFSFLSTPQTTVDQKTYTVTFVDNKTLDVGDTILFSYKDTIEFEDKAKLFSRSFYVGEVGRILTLPHGINIHTGKQIEQDKVLVECLTSGCLGNTQEIKLSSVFGKATPVE